MRRKAEREKAKKKRPKGNPEDWTAKEMSRETGVKVDQMMEWIEARSLEMQEAMAKNMAQLLWEAEDYMALANAVVILRAVIATFGDLKTVQKGLPKLVRNINRTIEEVDRMGIKEACQDLTKYGVEIEFEDFDINKIFDDPGKCRVELARMKTRWMTGKGGRNESNGD